MNAERNLALLREIEANRWFLLMAYRDNPALLARAEPRIREWIALQGQPGPDGRPPVAAEAAPTWDRRLPAG